MMHIHLKIANLMLVIALVLNGVMLVTIVMLNEKMESISSEVNDVGQSAESKFENITYDLSDLRENTSEDVSILNLMLKNLEGEVDEVGERSKSLEEELDYASTINKALESVVLIVWEDGEFVMGSGFFVSDDGYILTAAHVLEEIENNTVKIKTMEGEVIDAIIILEDNDSDTSILKAEGSFSHLELGDTERLNTGSKVFALGAPEGFSFSASEGIVSAVREVREITDEIGLEVGLGKNITVVQTDAAITHGNSGGPLIDKRGRVVGLNSFGIGVSSWGGYDDVEGLNFAISSKDLRNIWDAVLIE
jgi:S1-C subfamily serine protease